MDERLRFVAKLLDGETMSDVCREFGISRKTGYKVFCPGRCRRTATARTYDLNATDATGPITEEQGQRMISLVEAGSLNSKVAVDRLKAMALAAGVIVSTGAT